MAGEGGDVEMAQVEDGAGTVGLLLVAGELADADKLADGADGCIQDFGGFPGGDEAVVPGGICGFFGAGGPGPEGGVVGRAGEALFALGGEWFYLLAGPAGGGGASAGGAG